jgi:hypothetical protein
VLDASTLKKAYNVAIEYKIDNSSTVNNKKFVSFYKTVQTLYLHFRSYDAAGHFCSLGNELPTEKCRGSFPKRLPADFPREGATGRRSNASLGKAIGNTDLPSW